MKHVGSNANLTGQTGLALMIDNASYGASRVKHDENFIDELNVNINHLQQLYHHLTEVFIAKYYLTYNLTQQLLLKPINFVGGDKENVPCETILHRAQCHTSLKCFEKTGNFLR